MKKVQVSTMPEDAWSSPGGTFASFSRELSVALGRRPDATDLAERHPFDVEICRVPAGARMCPYHSHSAQWEFYHVLTGRGAVRDAEGIHAVEAGDAFLYKPNEPHQIINDSRSDLVVLIVADNPIGESCHYPDSGKWLVRGPERRILAGAVDAPYLHGEEDEPGSPAPDPRTPGTERSSTTGADDIMAVHGQSTARSNEASRPEPRES